MTPARALALLGLLLAPAVLRAQPAVPPEGFAPEPRQYVAYRAAEAPRIDGRIDEAAWQGAPWTSDFVDILGEAAPVPRFRTRARMLWDAHYFYIAAELDEPDVWATLRQRDTVIFHDNDFEVFIDPDGDTHAYYEIEVNALGTVWDLLLLRPYRDGGPPIDGWDIAGLKVATHVRGSLGRPGDRDRGWTVEMALPWAALAEAARGARPPRPGERWRLNFSRVEWQHDVVQGRYRRRTDPATGRPLPEDNWVWAPQGVVNMHLPEQWGEVQFVAAPAGADTVAFAPDPDRAARQMLRRLYYRQRAYAAQHGRYAATLDLLGGFAEGPRPLMEATPRLYEASLRGPSGATLRIRQDGRLTAEP